MKHREFIQIFHQYIIQIRPIWWIVYFKNNFILKKIQIFCTGNCIFNKKRNYRMVSHQTSVHLTVPSTTYKKKITIHFILSSLVLASLSHFGYVQFSVFTTVSPWNMPFKQCPNMEWPNTYAVHNLKDYFITNMKIYLSNRKNRLSDGSDKISGGFFRSDNRKSTSPLEPV